MLRWILTTSVAFLALTPAIAVEPKDLAGLFPAGTLAYAEIGNPSETSDAVAAFVKGTLLADSLGHSHDRRDNMMPPGSLGGLAKAGELSLLTSPEMLAELKKLRGVAAGLTGFDAKTSRPHLVVAIVMGDSTVAGLLARQYLLTSPNVRRVGKVEGIAVYQNRGLTGATQDDNGKPQPVVDPVPAQGIGEATYLYTPGLLVVGSSVPAVGDVYRRFAGLEKSASFAGAAILKPQAEVRKKPGVWFTVDVAGLDSQLIAAKKVSNANWLHADTLSYLRFLLNPKQVESLTGTWQLLPDGWALTASAEVKAGGSCPMLALLSGGAVVAEDGRAVPADARGSFTVAFPAKDKRAKAILDVANAIGQALGKPGALPGELADEAEKAGFKIASEYLPMVQSMTIFLPNVAGGKKPVEPHPILVLTLEDEASAKAWLAVVPKLSQLMSGAEKPPEPASEMIQGVKVWGLVHTPSTPIHYASAGSRIVVGQDRDAVATSAKLAGNPWPKSERPASAEGRMPFAVATEWRSALITLSDLRPSNESHLDFRRQNPDGGAGAAKVKLDFEQSFAGMPPLRLQARGSGQSVAIEFEQRELKKPLAKLLESLWQIIEYSPADGERLQRGSIRIDDSPN